MQKETATTSSGEKLNHFIPLTDNEEQLQAFANLYYCGITKQQITLILSTVRLNFEALGISPQPLLDSLSTYQKK